MLKQNNIWMGVLYGSVLPAVSLFIFMYLLKGDFVIHDKPGIPYLVAAFCNLIIIRLCHRAGADKLSMGLVLITFLFTIAIFALKIQPL